MLINQVTSQRVLKKRKQLYKWFLITFCISPCGSSVVSACLPSQSLRNQLTCLAAMNSAGVAGKGKSFWFN